MSDEAEREAMESEDDSLAAEFVLGVLSAEERSRCAARLKRDEAFARLVAEWEVRFSDLNDGFGEVAAPDRVKATLDRRLFGQTAKSGMPSLWSSLAFWRAFSGAAVAAALALLLVIALQTPGTPPPRDTLVATLAAEGGDARFIVLLDPDSSTLRVATVAGEKPEDRDFELWLIARNDVPLSLGLIEAKGAQTPVFDAARRKAFDEGVTLAVSLEPKGGSPTGAPTGPVVAAGSVKKI